MVTKQSNNESNKPWWLHKFGFGFFWRKLRSFIVLMVTFWFVGNRHMHGDFENIFTFETHRGNHASNQKEKNQKWRVTAKKKPTPRHVTKKPSKPNASWNIRKLADLASLNLCLAILNQIEAMQTNTTQNLYTFMFNLRRLKDNKSPHITHS